MNGKIGKQQAFHTHSPNEKRRAHRKTARGLHPPGKLVPNNHKTSRCVFISSRRVDSSICRVFVQ